MSKGPPIASWLWNLGLVAPRASQVALVVKNPLPSAGNVRDVFHPWVGKIPWRRAWQTIPVFLPGESPWTEECPWDCKESDTTEQLSRHTLVAPKSTVFS